MANFYGKSSCESGHIAPQPPPSPQSYAEGIVEIAKNGFGFLCELNRGLVQSNDVIFITPDVVQKYAIRHGMWICGETRCDGRGEQLFKLTGLESKDPDNFPSCPIFESLTPIKPNMRICLESVAERYTTRLVDLMTAIGKGQCGLIVGAPRTGKTTYLLHIAEAVVKNHPELKLIILLVNERLEEITDIRNALPTAELMASSIDGDVNTHVHITQLAVERAKRLVELGNDVIILMDSLTRIGQAFIHIQPGVEAAQALV
ncbi:MAG: hypothetical protein ACOYM3_07895 [Terrimicrobiaceae bacterium]